MKTFTNSMLCPVSYDDVIKACGGFRYQMSLTSKDEIKAVITAVNQGIDSHLEACYVPDRGDSYEGGERTAGKLVMCRTLDCTVSPESLPVLLRRLSEDGDEVGMSLVEGILTTLHFDDSGEYNPPDDEHGNF